MRWIPLVIVLVVAGGLGFVALRTARDDEEDGGVAGPEDPYISDPAPRATLDSIDPAIAAEAQRRANASGEAVNVTVDGRTWVVAPTQRVAVQLSQSEIDRVLAAAARMGYRWTQLPVSRAISETRVGAKAAGVTLSEFICRGAVPMHTGLGGREEIAAANALFAGLAFERGSATAPWCEQARQERLQREARDAAGAVRTPLSGAEGVYTGATTATIGGRTVGVRTR